MTRASLSAFSLAASGAFFACVTTPMSISAWSGSTVITASPLAVTEGGRSPRSVSWARAMDMVNRRAPAITIKVFMHDPFGEAFLASDYRKSARLATCEAGEVFLFTTKRTARLRRNQESEYLAQRRKGRKGIALSFRTKREIFPRSLAFARDDRPWACPLACLAPWREQYPN